ncbi:hypothetical protein RQP46_002316 [Phenoliferia psychrophenolica]
MADNDAPVASRATLSTLPLEIKARICELAALQDERYKERWIPGAPGENLVKVHKNEWRGRSLAALSETSKEFNELAAKHIFHTLSDIQIDSITFTLVVLPRHTFRRVFAALPGLPNLNDLQLSYATTQLALGDFGTAFDSPDGPAGQIRGAFRAVALRLRTVALVDFPSADSVNSFLQMCENVRNIKITGPVIVQDEKLLSESLGTHRTLERLTLDATSAGSAGLHLGNEWSIPLTWTRTLSGLDLVNVELDGSTVSLINQHAATLRSLTIRLPKDSPPNPPPDFPSLLPTPLLSSFILENTSSNAFEAITAAIATATSDSATPSSSHLTTLTVELKDSGRYLAAYPFEKAFKPFRKCIRHICATGPGGQMLSQGIVGLINKTPQTPVSTETALSVRHHFIKQALAYGVILADQFLEDETLEGMEIMLNSLGDIWGHKLLRDD